MMPRCAREGSKSLGRGLQIFHPDGASESCIARGELNWSGAKEVSPMKGLVAFVRALWQGMMRTDGAD